MKAQGSLRATRAALRSSSLPPELVEPWLENASSLRGRGEARYEAIACAHNEALAAAIEAAGAGRIRVARSVAELWAHAREVDVLTALIVVSSLDRLSAQEIMQLVNRRWRGAPMVWIGASTRPERPIDPATGAALPELLHLRIEGPCRAVEDVVRVALAHEAGGRRQRQLERETAERLVVEWGTRGLGAWYVHLLAHEVALAVASRMLEHTRAETNALLSTKVYPKAEVSDVEGLIAAIRRGHGEHGVTTVNAR
ncbi:MAG: hypothetical protein K8H88_23495 [Sandaracinaceae bacterium]|nr:hypothetical protein [Sandaracinaceae bacterium]